MKDMHYINCPSAIWVFFDTNEILFLNFSEIKEGQS